jgi:hypothetical protein
MRYTGNNWAWKGGDGLIAGFFASNQLQFFFLGKSCRDQAASAIGTMADRLLVVHWCAKMDARTKFLTAGLASSPFGMNIRRSDEDSAIVRRHMLQ